MKIVVLNLTMILFFSSCNFGKETEGKWTETSPKMVDKAFSRFKKKDSPDTRDFQDCVQLDGETYFFEYPGTIEFVFDVADRETVKTQEISSYINKKCSEDPFYFENIFLEILECMKPKRAEFEKKNGVDMEKLRTVSGAWIKECTQKSLKK